MGLSSVNGQFFPGYCARSARLAFRLKKSIVSTSSVNDIFSTGFFKTISSGFGRKLLIFLILPNVPSIIFFVLVFIYLLFLSPISCAEDTYFICSLGKSYSAYFIAYLSQKEKPMFLFGTMRNIFICNTIWILKC